MGYVNNNDKIAIYKNFGKQLYTSMFLDCWKKLELFGINKKKKLRFDFLFI